MAEVKPIPAKDAKEKTKKAISQMLPRVINDINNAINKAANACNNEAVYEYQDINTNIVIAASDQFTNAGYTVDISNKILTIKW